MRRTANIRVGELARLCTDPEEAERLMREAVNWGLQQNKRTIRMIKLERLLKCGVGTTKVEKFGERLAREARGGRRGPAEEREVVKTITTLPSPSPETRWWILDWRMLCQSGEKQEGELQALQPRR